MARVTDYHPDEKAGKPVVYEIIVENLVKTKAGWRSSYKHVITKPGAEEFFARMEE